MSESCIRKILPTAAAFKQFWKDHGPFKFALTSAEYPPVLLDSEEWVFGGSRTSVIKEVMQFKQKKMKIVPAPFNPKNKNILRPEEMCAWKITQFPDEWNRMVCSAFVPEGHLTRAVAEAADVKAPSGSDDARVIEAVFFDLVASQLDDMGYVLLGPRNKSKYAYIREYLEEWEIDDADAGLD